jgi:3-oxoacyl-[acyl-carrier protein] reductase
MGLIKNIKDAVKKEVKDYIFQMVEIEKENEKKPEQPVSENVKNIEVKAEQPAPKVEEKTVVKEEKVQPEKKEEVEEVREKPRKKEIYPIANNLEFVRVSYKKNQDVITIPRELAELIKMLPLEEYACFVKLYCFALEQRKNYGYWGGTLKRRIGLDQLSTSEFEELGNNLAAYGLLLLEQLTENQKTFVLYVPFDEETMVKLSTAKKPEKESEKPAAKKAEKPAPKAAKPKPEPKEEPETQREEDIPGKMVEGMENDEMYKSYKTFVSLEIDKAKMRVGRANFDKIYMEAVKYIDKKYGFKVLSDSDKFKEYLTNYYISAFDIPTFENWKKSKG